MCKPNLSTIDSRADPMGVCVWRGGGGLVVIKSEGGGALCVRMQCALLVNNYPDTHLFRNYVSAPNCNWDTAK